MYRIRKALGKLKASLLISWYLLFYYSVGLKNSWILVDSKNGKDLGSNMLRILEELVHNPEYKDYRIFLACKKEKTEDIRKMLLKYNLNQVKLLREGGLRYAKAAAKAKYLFTDTSFPIWFCKKEGQIITNTWHGTPLKMMGRDVENRAYDMGNVQKNHLIADYLIYPSDYMKDIMVSAYMLDNLYEGNILCSGYPRNSVFFDREKAEKLRSDLGFEGKRLYSYMPTWRGVLKHIDSQKNTDQLEYYFAQLDKKLREDEIFFVRLHPFIDNSIDYSVYSHIRPFPEGYEPYDILNICDCMVTDYSSVFFDYANTGNKIILFVFDKELYMDERGVYVSMDTFPFPQVRRVDELLEEMRTPKQYDDREFRAKYCTYDGVDVAAKLCRHVIKQEKQFEEFSVSNNGKENVLIYAGNMAKNGLTTALLNLLAHVDKEKRNYYITFRSSSLAGNPERVSLLPKDVGILPFTSIQGKSLVEMFAMQMYFNKNKCNPFIMKKVDRFYQRMYKSWFGHCEFGYAIHYPGYEKDIINLFQQASTKNVIFVHNDMVGELKLKGNQHGPSLRRAYHTYWRVAAVTSDIYKPTLELGKNEKNIRVVNNCHDYQAVRERAECEISFESDTVCTVSVEKLKEILNSKSRKFINIGRFSKEKGHSMLMKAFNRYYSENPDSYLIIIGGYGTLYEQTVAQAGSLPAGSHIVIIKSVANPMPILKKCDMLVLSSLYEGLGLVLLEADTLGIPVFSTDVPGPQGFMKEYGGYLVQPDEDGIYEGFRAFEEGRIKPMLVDYEAYNQHAIQQFEQLFEGEACI